MKQICPKGYTIQELELDEPCEYCEDPAPCLDEEWIKLQLQRSGVTQA